MNLQENIHRIRQMMGLNEMHESNDYGYFKDKSNIHDYDAILFGYFKNELPPKYNGWEASLKMMSKEEYLQKCAKLQETSYSDQYGFIVPEQVKNIENKMSQGIKYDIPYLNYVEKTQEGRHRVVAASNLGQEKIPVLILTKEEKEEEDFVQSNISTMIGKWNDLTEINGKYYCVFNKSETSFYAPIHDLLSSIVPDYDYYFLDHLFDIENSPSTYGSNPQEFILKAIKNKDRGLLKYLRHKPYYDGYSDNVNQEILNWAVVLKAMINNNSVIWDTVKKTKDKYYLRILDTIKENFNEFKNCKDMLEKISESQYYVKKYDLLSVENNNSLYDLTQEDVIKIENLMNK